MLFLRQLSLGHVPDAFDPLPSIQIETCGLPRRDAGVSRRRTRGGAASDAGGLT
jgi:hypothetical protein